MEPSLYSIRMHATRNGKHHCGAERLTSREVLEPTAGELLRRALEHSRGRAEAVYMTVEALAGTVHAGKLPDLITFEVEGFRQGRIAARRLLEAAGVAPEAARRALEEIVRGPAPGGDNMRGAMLVGSRSGVRLEPDPARGVRASRMDLSPQAESRLRQELAVLGLDNTHVREALVLAAKVLAAPGIMAELCWSDDPDYTAGYVASPQHGYQRLPHLKPRGDARGGRAFFVREEGLELAPLMRFLEEEPMLIEKIGRLHPPCRWEG